MNCLVDELMSQRYLPKGITSDLNKRMVVLSFMNPDRFKFSQLFKVIKNNVVYNITHLSHLQELLYKYIIQKNEIDTPLSLVYEILDKLPINIWHDPKSTFLNPVSGSGIFSLVVINKLMIGLSSWESDREKRYRHIIENMITVYDNNIENIFLYKCLFDPYDKYNLKANHDNILSEENLNKKDKYTLVIGIPPLLKTQYIPYINNLIDKCDLMAYIIPAKFTINIPETNHFDNLKKNGLSHIQFINDKYLGYEKLVYFIKGLHSKMININDVTFIDPTESIYNYTHKIEHSIMYKISDLWKISMKRGENISIPNNYEYDDDYSIIKTKTHGVKILARLGTDKPKEYVYTKDNKGTSCNKLVIPRTSMSINPSRLKDNDFDFIHSTYVPSDINITRSVMYIPVKNIEESQRLSWYLGRSIWVKYIFIKYNTFTELSKKIFSEYIPVIPLDVIMDDQSIFDFFKLNDSEVNYIKNVVSEIIK